MNDDKFLEKFFQIAILPHYNGELNIDDIKWFSHGKTDSDSWAHYFHSGGIEYVLTYDDFPNGSYLSDGLTHEIVLSSNNDRYIELKFNNNKNIDNITGWYALFKEKRQ